MPRRPNTTLMAKPSSDDEKPSSSEVEDRRPKRSAFLWLALFVLLLNGSWAVHHIQFENLPLPLSAEKAGKRGFSEVSAMEHVQSLTKLGPHPVGSDALDLALQYVFAASEKMKRTAHWEVDVQVDFFHAKIGASRLASGLFKGKTHIYSDLKHVVLRILPKYLPAAEENLILVSSHIDTVFATEGAGDCSSCVGVMLELARGISQWAHGFKNGVIFLFNTGEEEGLNGAHSFITQHPWSRAIRFVIDLEAMGIGGKSSLFQGGSAPWAIETFAKVAKYPSGQIIAQDLFLSGAIKSATDLQVYQEVAGLPGLDFAYSDATAVYHTKNDKLKLLKPGSLQHLGENMLAFLLHTAMSSRLHKVAEVEREEGTNQTQAIFFDVLGKYMVVYTQQLASMLHNSVILQSLLIWIASLLMGGYPGAISFGLSCLSIVLMWIFSLSLTILVAFIIPLISTSPVPYIAYPWLVVGLFGAPAMLGALTGQHVGFFFLKKYLHHVYKKRVPSLSHSVQENLINWEAERWLFKSGFIQWLILLVVGNLFKVGSSFLALVWLVSPAFAYGLMEATLSPTRLPKQLKIITLILGLAVPVLVSAGMITRLVGTIIGVLVRFERSPGSAPDWLGSLIVAIFSAAVVCLMLVYLLSYIHLSGAKGLVIFSMCTLLALTLTAVSSGIFPTFTEDISRAVNVVHVVDTTGRYGSQDPASFVSLFSATPGKLTKEVENLKDEEFACGRNKTLDFVTFTVNYGCWSSKDGNNGWSKLDIPELHVESDYMSDVRKTRVLIDTKLATRWSLAVNGEEISDFTFEVGSEELVPSGNKSMVDGWHIIQFAGGKNSPTKFHLNLFWSTNTSHPSQKAYKQAEDAASLLLKLRTDVNMVTPKVERVLQKLPHWCSLFGKSTSPYTLAFLSALPVQF
uniref:Vacuolar membrane protease n=2 Tax=Elaeis guineensis var. tenera TaxID=51953 RepID=A0A6J0PAY8_ELAGV|nr:endoplasmic reticulum metallopeptidase 1 isoform X1 [Elaeis guineensis]XP_010943483.1 endoplasmic reticulum metallopeptidase 1 isoform X1 [Elaeis guineensis]XP_019701584.1 endoplasmic reticulum metallopeptidase 1 isoform X1 [Elaeis guineensis]